MNLWMLLRGCALGIGAAAPIGPVNVEIARRTLRSGFRAGFALGCGAVTVDVAYAVCVSLAGPGLQSIQSHKVASAALGFAGGALLAYLGISCLRHAAREESIDVSTPPSSARNYLTGLLLTSLNPMTLAFWFVAVPGAVVKITPNPSRDLPTICIGVFIAALAWVFAFTGTMSTAGRMGKKHWMQFADIFGGSLLLLFAALAIWRAGASLISYRPLSN